MPSLKILFSYPETMKIGSCIILQTFYGLPFTFSSLIYQKLIFMCNVKWSSLIFFHMYITIYWWQLCSFLKLSSFCLVVPENTKYLSSNIVTSSNMAGRNMHRMFCKSFNEGGEKYCFTHFCMLKWIVSSISYLLFFPMGQCYTSLHFDMPQL